MSDQIGRRAMLAALPGLALAMTGRGALADRVILPMQLPLSVDDIARIGDDENAMMDALSYLMWRAPSMQGVLGAAPIGLKMRADNKDFVSYAVPYSQGGPYSLPLPDDPELAALIDKLAVLFTCQYVNTLGGQFAGAVNPSALSKLLGETAGGATAQRQSDNVYFNLLMQTKSDARPGAPTFVQAAREGQSWGPKFAELLTSDKFIQLAVMRPPEKARRELSVDRYKLKQLDPRALAQVDARWSAPDLKGSVFSLAVHDPWPPNYFAKLYADRVNPMAPLVGGALEAGTSVDPRKLCQLIYSPNTDTVQQVCDPPTVGASVGAVWQVLRNTAAPLGVLANPNYPVGVD